MKYRIVEVQNDETHYELDFMTWDMKNEGTWRSMKRIDGVVLKFDILEEAREYVRILTPPKRTVIEEFNFE
jgi:uncharacterized protein (DUF1499 family)